MTGTSPVARVCLVTNTFYPVVGGGETHARGLAEEIHRRQGSVVVLTYRVRRDWPRFERVGSVPVYRLSPAGFLRTGKYLMMPALFLRLVRLRAQYDVIYVCGFRVLGPVSVVAGRLLGKVCVLRAESCGEMSGDFARTPFVRRHAVVSAMVNASLRVRDLLLRRADAFLSISSAIHDELVAGRIPVERIHDIPNGIDLGRFTRVDGARKAELRRRLGLPDGTLFVYTGKLNRGKGLEYLLRVWSRVTAECADVHLALVGSGDLQSLSCEGELREYVRSAGLTDQVTFTGYVSNVHDYLHAADVFVLPSESEAFPLSLLEAMACGLRCIASRVGGIVDIAGHAAELTLVESANVDELYRAIGIAVHEPWTPEQAEAMRAQVLRYGMDRVAGAHLELFAGLLRTRKV